MNICISWFRKQTHAGQSMRRKKGVACNNGSFFQRRSRIKAIGNLSVVWRSIKTVIIWEVIYIFAGILLTEEGSDVMRMRILFVIIRIVFPLNFIPPNSKNRPRTIKCKRVLNMTERSNSFRSFRPRSSIDISRP
uniref:Citrolysin protein 2 n=1 Tax=Citrobacter freundii TaxID=546 RepID=CIR2_CITFR|nr:RecName: Full=Citrolysin protein 2 [Citrobacter freundii]prf//1501260B citrolysin [Citrobacter freundii]